MGTLMTRLISTSLRYPAVVLALTACLVMAGLWAVMHLGVEAFPDLTPNQVQVMAAAPGLSSEEIESQVSYPIETAMLGLPRTQGVRSISKAGISVVSVTFDDDVDLYFARTQVQQRMQDAIEALPQGVMPMLGPPATAMGEVFQYLLESHTVSPIELRNIQEYTIKPLLRTIPGVADVNSWGGMVQQYQVTADPVRLQSYGVTLADVETALANNNENFGAGYIEHLGDRLRVRGLGRATTSEDLGNIVVVTHGGTPILVRDVATVAIGSMPREGAVSRDGQGEALSATVVVLKGANAREVISRVEDRLKEVNLVLPTGVTLRPFYNEGDVVDRTTTTVTRNLVEGGLLVILILFLFLHDVRASLITASVIPLALLAAFILMRRFNVSANLMSLGALDFGLIVDASVVMVENFVRRLGHLPGQVGPLGPAERRALLRDAALDVARPIVFGVAIIIAVYLPIFSLEGLEGRMFAPMAFTVCAAVFGSLLLALTYIPAISAYALRVVPDRPVPWFERVRMRYERMLVSALTHRSRVVWGAAGLLLIALASVPFLGTEFMPKLDEGSMLIETRRLPSTALPDGMSIARDVEATLLRFPEVKSVVTNLGRPELAIEAMGLYQADVYVLFNPKDRWRAHSLAELTTQMDSALAQIPGLDYDFSAPMAMRLDELVSGVRTDLGIKVYGDSLPLLQAKAEEIKQIVDHVHGAADVSVGVSAGGMQLALTMDRVALARYGLTVADVRDAVQAAVGGVHASTIVDGRRRFDVVVRLPDTYRVSPEAMEHLVLNTPNGGRVTLGQVVHVHVVEGPETINHEGGERFVVVQSNVRGRDLGSFAAEVQQRVAASVRLPEGYFLTYGGQFENQTRALKRLGIIVPLVLLLILGLLYASFGNARQALLVMLNVPFALVGGIAMLWLRGLNLNLSASVGFIALFGVAVLNGIVLVTAINALRAGGNDLMHAVRQGAVLRLRPVLMTALVAGVGFVPMALSTSPGSEVQRPLATVVIGGLVTSTLLTLFVLPTIYAWIEEWRKADAQR